MKIAITMSGNIVEDTKYGMEAVLVKGEIVRSQANNQPVIVLHGDVYTLHEAWRNGFIKQVCR